jgi:hypothetical protein
VGAGALAPAVRIDTLVYGPLTDEHALHLIDERRHALDAEMRQPAPTAS